MDHKRHIATKYSNDEKRHAASNSQLFKKLNLTNNAFFEVELAKAKIHNKEPIIAGFFDLQSSKLRMLELYYNFFKKFCDVAKVRELGIDTLSL